MWTNKVLTFLTGLLVLRQKVRDDRSQGWYTCACVFLPRVFGPSDFSLLPPASKTREFQPKRWSFRKCHALFFLPEDTAKKEKKNWKAGRTIDSLQFLPRIWKLLSFEAFRPSFYLVFRWFRIIKYPDRKNGTRSRLEKGKRFQEGRSSYILTHPVILTDVSLLDKEYFVWARVCSFSPRFR